MEKDEGEEEINSILNNFTSKMSHIMNIDGWEDQGILAMKTGDVDVNIPNSSQPKSFATIVNAEQNTPKVHLRTLFNADRVDDTDFVLLVENVERAHNKFANSLVGFFVGKKVAFTLVKNYVTNTWSKFGFQRVMSDDEGVFSFKFTSMTGMEQDLEQGPWMIRNQPLILTKWAPNLELSKDKATRVPVWVKIHKVPVVAYSADGMSLIASQIRKPIMSDAFTSTMCNDPWGRIGYARALIEISAEKDVKKEVTMAVPLLNGEGHIKERMVVEYEWLPARCMDCLVFGHDSNGCPKRVVEPVTEKNDAQTDGFITVNRKIKGKRVDDGQPWTIAGIKLTKPKPNFMWSAKSNQPATKTQKSTTDDINLVTLKNNFSALQDQDEVFIANDVGASSSGPKDKKDYSDQDADKDEDDDVEEVIVEQSHVGNSGLNNLCPKVFWHWQWTSNGAVCTKGSRIILGWNPDVVNMVVISFDDQRRVLWDNLQTHKAYIRGRPWCLLGDFNVSLSIDDKSTGTSYVDTAIRDFQECVEDLEVMDVNSIGLRFTWNQKPCGADGVLNKIDRIMANLEVSSLFVGASAYFHPYRISDHTPTILWIPMQALSRPRTFKFSNILIQHPKFKEIVKNEWNKNVSGFWMFKVVRRLKLLKKPLRKLLYDQGNVFETVKRLRHELDTVQQALDSDPSNIELREEEVAYLRSYKEASRVPTIFIDHYTAFLGQQGTICPLISTDLFQNQLTFAQAEEMIGEVSDSEIRDAIFSMGDDKSPGPDGFSAAFFKEAWDIISQDIIKAIREFFANGILLKELNHTILALIPKVATPMKINDYRPISCCNSAFVPGRRISDNVLLTQELMHNYHLDRGAPRCAFKVDIQKAYDTVDWNFLRDVLIGFGFQSRMVDDLFLFAHGDASSARVIMDGLEEFKNVFGLTPSLSKSTAYFCNVLNHVKAAILAIMPFEEGRLLVKYLGVPLVPSRLLYRDCTELVEKVKKRIFDWKNKFLSLAGRAQLVRSVLASMHVFWALVFILPSHLMLEIEQSMRGFLWCQGKMRKGKAKVAWEDVCLPKYEGGLGIRRLEFFNQALISTHIWSILSLKDSLWVKWIHTYKLQERSLWEIPLRDNMSWGWRKILQVRHLVRPFIWYRVGDGLKVSAWFDNWCSYSPLSNSISNRHIYEAGFQLSAKVSNVVSHGNWLWLDDWHLKYPMIYHMHTTIINPNDTAWNQLKPYMCLSNIPSSLNLIIDFLVPLANKKSAKSLIAKLVFAAACYFIWKERNDRLFSQKSQNPEHVTDSIISTVCLRLTSYRFKKTENVERFLLLWKIPSSIFSHNL
ncbi:hypothetical protein Tco_1384949 [Tanacetum coccineum]